MDVTVAVGVMGVAVNVGGIGVGLGGGEAMVIICPHAEINGNRIRHTVRRNSEIFFMDRLSFIKQGRLAKAVLWLIFAANVIYWKVRKCRVLKL